MNITSPYINTWLYSRVSLHPSHMDNDIYKHLKNNLIQDYQGKNFESFGNIIKIFKIEERSAGKIIHEDPSASATFKVKFSCKLCRPLQNTIIVCRIENINKSIIYLKNGPIAVFVFDGTGNINQNKFIFDDKQNILLAKYGNKGKPVLIGSYAKIKILSMMIEKKSQKINVVASLEGMATPEEINESIKSLDSTDTNNLTEYDTYINSAEPIIEDEEIKVTESEADTTDDIELSDTNEKD